MNCMFCYCCILFHDASLCEVVSNLLEFVNFSSVFEFCGVTKIPCLLPVCRWPIPCHVCLNTDSLFLLLEQFSSLLSILNSAKHNTRLSGSFPTFCGMILTFVTTDAPWGCVEKVLRVSQWKETTVVVISFISSTLVFPTRWTKKQYSICFQIGPANNTIPIVLDNMQFRRSRSKKALPCASDCFVTCVPICISHTKFRVLCPRK